MLRSTAFVTLTLALTLSLPVAVAADDCVAPATDEPTAALARTDHDVSGNRIARGCGPLALSLIHI